MIWAAYGGRNYVFHSDEEKTKLREVIRMKNMKLPGKCIFFENRIV